MFGRLFGFEKITKNLLTRVLSRVYSKANDLESERVGTRKKVILGGQLR